MKKQQKTIDLNKLKSSCKKCSLRELCLPRGMNQSDLDLLDEVVNQTKLLQSGQHLFQQGCVSHAIYAVRSGAIKTYHIADDGTEQILGFHLPGELVGLDSLADNHYHCSAEVLGTSSFCELPIEQIDTFCHDVHGLQRQLLRIMSEELISEHEALFLLSKKSAEERLATFLISLSSRYHARGMSPVEFHLPMSRTDIANYLGLTAETISRLFAQFQKQGIIAVELKLVKILDNQNLQKIVGDYSGDVCDVARK